MSLLITFWGVRGTCPSGLEKGGRVGSHTACVGVDPQDGRNYFIFDAGSGAIPLGHFLKKKKIKNITFFISHFHLDHLQGLPFFDPCWDKETHITFYAPRFSKSLLLENILKKTLFGPPLFPIEFTKLPATFSFKYFEPEEIIFLSPATHILTLALNHPGGSAGYRLDQEGKSVCYLSDHEHVAPFKSQSLVTFAKKTDLMIFDTTFTPHDLPAHEGWGHSTWELAVNVAHQAEVKRLALFHHNPLYNDTQLLEIEKQARAAFPETFLAREGVRLLII